LAGGRCATPDSPAGFPPPLVLSRSLPWPDGRENAFLCARIRPQALAQALGAAAATNGVRLTLADEQQRALAVAGARADGAEPELAARRLAAVESVPNSR
jgi:hypothetical protein